MTVALTIPLVQLLSENIFWLFRDLDWLIADFQQCTMFLDNPLPLIEIVTKVLKGFVTFSFVSRVTNLIKQLYLSYRINRLNSILIQIIYMVLLFESFDKFQSPEDISADRIDIWPAGLKPIQFHDDFAAKYPN